MCSPEIIQTENCCKSFLPLDLIPIFLYTFDLNFYEGGTRG